MKSIINEMMNLKSFKVTDVGGDDQEVFLLDLDNRPWDVLLLMSKLNEVALHIYQDYPWHSPQRTFQYHHHLE